MPTNLMTTLRNSMDGFSKGQKRIANFILEHYDKAAFMTAKSLGNTVGVSESTVVRFAAEIGYDGYPHMQKELQDMLRTQLTAVQRIEVTSHLLHGHNILKQVLESDIAKINYILATTDDAVFEQALELLLNAKNIYIVGLRSSSFLAGYMGLYLNLLFGRTTVITSTADGDIFERILHIGEGDLLIGISFPRYSKRMPNVLQFAKDRGASLVTITDSMTSPIAAISNCSLLAPCETASFVDSLVAPMSLINALIVSLGIRRKDEISKTFEVLEDIWDEYGTYERIEN
ncbi:MurR/RpiR family transcriptional regulator [Oscillospiraceae bacterium OttesenSCG-928-G22]|nr:MurR/RpiR family transcriptional regulator [Oscillospiraceae bacterium OttesenSCG-928-G22]